MRLALTFLLVLGASATAQSNPVPFVSQALSPTSVQPGAAAFTLTVNGTGFAPTAVVHWDGASRLTIALSGTDVMLAPASSAPHKHSL